MARKKVLVTKEEAALKELLGIREGSSEYAVEAALKEREEIADKLEAAEKALSELPIMQRITDLQEADHMLEAAIKAYAMKAYKSGAGNGFESDDWLVTKVQGTTRYWNPEVLKRLVPPSVFKRVTTISINKLALDEEVRSGKISVDQVAEAMEEHKNAPSIKITRRSQGGNHDEAANLLAKLSA